MERTAVCDPMIGDPAKYIAIVRVIDRGVPGVGAEAFVVLLVHAGDFPKLLRFQLNFMPREFLSFKIFGHRSSFPS